MLAWSLGLTAGMFTYTAASLGPLALLAVFFLTAFVFGLIVNEVNS